MMRARLRHAAAAATAAALLVLLTADRGHAHGLEPALLSLREMPGGLFEVSWKSSALRLPGADVQPVLPARCRAASSPVTTDESDRVRQRWMVDCGPAGLSGESIAVDDLAVAKIDALLRIERRDGETIQTVLTARAPSFIVPARPSRGEVWRSYVGLGIENILMGPDHLLFVFGLLLLAAVTHRFIQAIVAFTLGHSVALSAAALHVGVVPPPLVAVLIALSVLILAVELARDVPQHTVLRRFPWVMAAAFGLLHGLGFAGGLGVTGLPPADVPLALMSFNVGIEIGQLTFVGTLLAGSMLLARWMPAAASRCTRPAVYAMGILAAFWCFERVAIWLA